MSDKYSNTRQKKRAKSPEMIEIEIKQNKNSFFLIEE